MVIVVSDSSPIILLSLIGQHDLLRQLYGKVIIPPMVLSEILEGGPAAPGFAEVSGLPWFEVRTLSSDGMKHALQAKEGLDDGEAEAIALALEAKADVILIDERAGRKAAEAKGLSTVGVLGVLLRAKRAGLVPEIGPFVTTLLSSDRFWAAEQLIQEILQAADESPSP
jgi:uncharacterized protein